MYFALADTGNGQENLKIGGYKLLKTAISKLHKGMMSGTVYNEKRLICAIISNGLLIWVQQ